jgi:hypothetical protein
LNYLRTGRQISEPKEPLLIKEGFLMAKGKRKMSKKQKAALARGRKRAAAKRSHGFEGYAGGKKRRKPRVSHVVTMHGDPGSVAVDTAIDLSGLLAGAIGLSLLSSVIPVKKPLIRPLIAMAAGIFGLFVPVLRENRFGNRAALGSLSIGSYSLLKQLAPKMPLMGAADTAEGIGAAIENLPPEEKAILGILPENPQQQLDYDASGGTEEIGGNEPGEMLGSEAGEMLGNDPGEMLGTTERIGADDGSDFE